MLRFSCLRDTKAEVHVRAVFCKIKFLSCWISRVVISVNLYLMGGKVAVWGAACSLPRTTPGTWGSPFASWGWGVLRRQLFGVEQRRPEGMRCCRIGVGTKQTLLD